MSIATTNPATGEVLKNFEPISDAQLEEKLQRAVEAFTTYRKTTFASRAALMMKAAEILEADKEKFGRMMTTEMGKTYRSAVDEAVKCAWVCRYYAEHAEKFLADEAADVPGSQSFVRYLPLGPILAVMPWNFPFWQVFRFIAPSLMAGNVGLLKHASNVPQSALMIEDVLRRAGFPEGVFQTLLIGSNKVAKILADPRIKAAARAQAYRSASPRRRTSRKSFWSWVAAIHSS
jgi:succinate-semialdehyde dehydrogenase/glutarate-semialdehyde dehydrogenase